MKSKKRRIYEPDVDMLSRTRCTLSSTPEHQRLNVLISEEYFIIITPDITCICAGIVCLIPGRISNRIGNRAVLVELRGSNLRVYLLAVSFSLGSIRLRWNCDMYVESYD